MARTLNVSQKGLFLTDSYIYRNARTINELNDVFDIRYKVLTEELSRIPKKYVSDIFDSIATNFIAYRSGVPVGTVRVITDNQLREMGQTAFSGESKVDLTPYRTSGINVMEVSRLAILNQFRRTPVIRSLCACAYHFSRIHMCNYAFIIASCEMDRAYNPGDNIEVPRLFKNFGFEAIGPIKKPGYYDSFNCYSVPMLIQYDMISSRHRELYERLRAETAINYVELSGDELQQLYLASNAMAYG